MRRSCGAVGILVAVSSAGVAQSRLFDYHNTITVGGGAAIPAGNSTNGLSTAPMITVGYGYRFNRWFQADAGANFAFGAANNHDLETTDFGVMRGHDVEFMLPFGGRVFIPTPYRRFAISAGAGAVYLRYSETVNQGDDEIQNNCYSCTARDGWAGYGLANVGYFLDSRRNLHLGTTVQYIVGRTNGQSVGEVPGLRTTDRWLNVVLEFGVSF